MPSNPGCSSVPAMETPPGIDPSGKYLVIIDQYGNPRSLARPSGASTLIFDGDDIYFVDGSNDLPWNMPSLRVADFNEAPWNMKGILGINAGGRIFSLVNESGTEKILKCAGGQWYLGEGLGDIGGDVVPATGVGVLVRMSEELDPEFFALPGLIFINSDGIPTQVPMGTSGQVLFNSAGTPEFKSLPSGNIASGSNIATLEAVSAGSISASEVNVTCPSMKLTDGATDITVANVNVTVDLTNGVDLLGLDDGAEQANKWYYIYIISDGALVSAVISEDMDAPDLSDPAFTGYTFYAFATVFRNNAAGNIETFVQRGRDFFTTQVNMSDDISVGTTLATIAQSTPMTNIIPPITKTARGIAGGSSAASSFRSMLIAADIGGVGLYFIGATEHAGAVEGFKKDAGMFVVPILDPFAPSLAWKANAIDNHRRISFTGYSI